MSAEKQKTILLVEDEVIIAMAEKMTLEKFGHKVITANTGEEAVALVEKTPGIDLILMDIDLGKGMDGTEAAALILADRDLPVVFLSSHMEPEIVAKTEKITSYGYVVKNSSVTVLDVSIKMAFKLFAAKIKEKEKEAALRESEASYRVLFSGASDGILLADAQTRQFRYANPAICRMLGYTEDEFQRIGVADIHPQESLDHVLAEFVALTRGETRSSPELPCLRKDGTVFYADISHSAVTLEGREYHAGFFHDITERRRANNAIKESELRLKAQYRGMPIPTFTWRKKGEDFELIDFNDAAKIITHEKTSEFVGRKASDLYAGRQDILHDLQQCSVENKVIKRETLSEHFIPGKYITLTIVPIPADLIMVHMEDISERKRAESEKEAALEALRESEDRYRDLVENSQDLICTHDLEGKILSMNETAVRLTGYPLKELLGMNMADLLVPGVRYLFKAYMTEIQAMGWSRGTMRIQTASGEHRYWEYYNTLRTRDVTVPIVRALGHDITERERAEKIQHIQYVIANAMNKAETLASLLETVRNELSSLLDTTNFLLALYDEASGMLSAPFERDEKDTIPQWPAEKSLTGQVIKQKRSLLLRGEEIRQLDEAGTTEQVGSNAKAWLGVPLQINGKVLGAIVVQSYDKALAYDQNGVSLLEIIANQLSAYIERKQAEKALRESEEQFRSLYENSTIGIYRTIPSGKIIMANPALIKMLGYSSFAEVASRDLKEDWFQPSYPRRQFIEKFAEQDEVTGLETAWKRRDGSTIFIREGARAVRNAQGDILYFDGTVEDITERMRAEEEIQRQLAEKEILLKEVHHRIKNNIASIGGLLSLRLQSISDSEAVSVLQDAIGRVNSMRVLYDKLLLSEDYKDIPVKNYVESLTAAIVALFPGSTKIKVEKRIADFPLEPKRLFPLGLIINELITNKMKYAFINRGSGTIRISLEKACSHVTLAIEDDGNRLTEGFDVNKSEGFGLMLVKMLSQQLGGSFSIAAQAGTPCRIEFNV